MDIDFDSEVERLSEATNRPAAEVAAEVQALVDKGFSVLGAFQKWKSDNKGLMPVPSAFYAARCLAKELPVSVETRDGGLQDVQNVHFAYVNEDGDVEFNYARFWGDRIEELASLFTVGSAYSFNASLSRRGRTPYLIRVADVTMIPDDMAPSLGDCQPTRINDLKDSIGTNELVHGVVSKVIYQRDNPVPLGFEVGDEDSLFPLTVWYKGQYSRMDHDVRNWLDDNLREDLELFVFGYIRSATESQMNAVSVIPVE